MEYIVSISRFSLLLFCAFAPSGAQVILGPNSLIQAALPAIFEHTPPEYYSELNAQLEAQAACVCAQLKVRS